MCGEGGVPQCHKRGCGKRCYYKNWNWHEGWAQRGEEVQAYDDKDGCPKYCQCKKGKMKCGGEHECIYY